MEYTNRELLRALDFSEFDAISQAFDDEKKSSRKKFLTGAGIGAAVMSPWGRKALGWAARGAVKLGAKALGMDVGGASAAADAVDSATSSTPTPAEAVSSAPAPSAPTVTAPAPSTPDVTPFTESAPEAATSTQATQNIMQDTAKMINESKVSSDPRFYNLKEEGIVNKGEYKINAPVMNAGDVQKDLGANFDPDRVRTTVQDIKEFEDKAGANVMNNNPGVNNLEKEYNKHAIGGKVLDSETGKWYTPDDLAKVNYQRSIGTLENLESDLNTSKANINSRYGFTGKNGDDYNELYNKAMEAKNDANRSVRNGSQESAPVQTEKKNSVTKVEEMGPQEIIPDSRESSDTNSKDNKVPNYARPKIQEKDITSKDNGVRLSRSRNFDPLKTYSSYYRTPEVQVPIDPEQKWMKSLEYNQKLADRNSTRMLGPSYDIDIENDYLKPSNEINFDNLKKMPSGYTKINYETPMSTIRERGWDKYTFTRNGVTYYQDPNTGTLYMPGHPRNTTRMAANKRK